MPSTLVAYSLEKETARMLNKNYNLISGIINITKFSL